MKVKLQDFIEGAITRMVAKSNGQGGYTNARIEFLPQTVYTVEDELLKRYIRGEEGDVLTRSVYSESLLQELKAANVPYSTQKCGTCSGASLKLVYNPFKILEDD